MNTPQSILRRCAAILQDYAFGLQDRMEFLRAEKVQQPLRRLRLAELEDRILLSASPVAAIAPDGFPDAVWHTAPAQVDSTGIDSPSGRQSASDVTDENSVRHELVVVDPAADDYQQLIDDLLLGGGQDREFEVLLLDQSRDGIEQISELLADYKDVDAIHLVSHGFEGNVRLGSTTLNLDNLAAYAGQIGGWHDSLSADADLLIYGCNLAANNDGRELVDALSVLTEADVAASDNLTGHESLGGDWNFEFTVGLIDTDVAFSSDMQDEWRHILPTIKVNVDNSTLGYTEDDGPVVIDSGFNTQFGNPLFVSATVQITPGTYQFGEDYLSYTGATGGLAIAQTDDSIMFSGSATRAFYEALLQTVEYTNTSIDPDLTMRTVEFTINDGSNTDMDSRDISINAVNSTPTVDQNNNLSVTEESSVVITNADLKFIDDDHDASELTYTLTNILGLDGQLNLSGFGALGLNDTFTQQDIDAGFVSFDSTGEDSTATFDFDVRDNNLPVPGITGTFTFTFDVTNFNDDPNFTSPGSVSIAENITNALVVNAVDPEAAPVQYFKVGGVDASKFSIDINTGLLTFDTVPDFENPTDVGLNNTYQVTIEARDGVGGIASQNITVTITDYNEAPVNTVPGDQSTPLNTPLTFSTANGNQISTDDENGGSITVTLTTVPGEGTVTLNLPYGNANPTGPESRVNMDTTAGTQSEPRVARAADGRYVAVWSGNGGSGGQADSDGIWMQRYNADGTTNGVEERLNGNPNRNKLQYAPDVAINDSGRIVVTWVGFDQDAGGTDDGIFARAVDWLGGNDTGELAINTYTTADQYEPAVSINAAGDFIVAWTDDFVDTQNEGVFARRFNSAGTALDANEFQVNTYFWNSQERADVEMHNDGSFVIVWQSQNQEPTGTQNGIFGKRFDASANPLDAPGTPGVAEFQINDETFKDQSEPSLAMDDSGNFVVVWQSQDQSPDSKDGIFGKRYTADGFEIDAPGTPGIAEFHINTHVADKQEVPSVAMDGDGDFIVVWQSEDQDNPGELEAGFPTVRGVYAQQFAKDGTTVGGETLINSTTAGQQRTPDVAMDANGEFIAVWQGVGTGDGDGVFRRQYVSPPSTLVISVGTGVNDTTVTFSGTQSEVNNALNGLIFTPDAAFPGGTTTLQIATDDQGFTGPGGNQYDTDIINIDVVSDSVTPIADNDTARNAVDESASPGATVGITALADDPDVIDTVSYSLDNNAGGMFDIDSGSGVVTLLGALDAEVTSNYSITVRAVSTDGSFSTRTFNIAVNDVAEVNALWFATAGDVTASGNPDQANWNNEEVLQFSDPTLNFDPAGGTTTGELDDAGFDLSNFGAGVNTRIDAIHHVYSDMTVAGFALQAGDVLLSVDDPALSVTLTSNTEPNKTFDINDVFLFRPLVAGDYSTGDFFHLLDNPLSALGATQITGVSLVESTAGTLVGDMTLAQGTFLLTHDAPLAQDRIYVFAPTSVGDGTTSGPAPQILLEGSDAIETANSGNLGFSQAIDGIHLVEYTTMIGNATVNAGDILISTTGPATIVATPVEGQDVTLLRMTNTRIGNNHSLGTATLLFDGSDEAMLAGDTAEDISALTFVEGAAVNSVPTGSVTISGTPTEDQMLSASNTLADADGLGSISYQWKRDGVDIGGATATTYTLGDADVNKTITVVASYTDGGGTNESVGSAGVGPIANVNDAPTGTVTISGTSTEDQMLTASNTLADADGLGIISYQWKRDGVDIGGATGTTYTLGDADVNKTITVVASYTDGWLTAESVTSSGVGPIANVNDAPTGTVTISGTSTEDQMLTASNTLADADGLGTISYQWKQDGVDIGGATAATYTLGDADVNKTITVAASYADGWLTAESVISAGVGPIANVNDLPTGSVTISGTPTEDQMLTASNTLADADGPGIISYQWKRDGVDIGGATGTTYTLGDADVNKTITVVASYTDGWLTAESVTSMSVGPIANVNDTPTGSVTISGTPTEDQLLTANNTLADADGLGVISYQWKRDGIDIGGATATTYTLGDADVNTTITVVAGYTDGWLTAESVSSAGVGLIANVNDLPTGSVTISGTPTEDQMLTASDTLADADGLGPIGYQWKRDGIDIGGATATTYTLGDADVNTTITVVASYTDGWTTAESVTSSGVGLIANVNDAPTGAVNISGIGAEGQLLTASNTLADADGLGPISYQWKRDGIDIGGATATTYTLAAADVATTITVVASYTDGYLTPESVTSAGLGPIAPPNYSPTGSVTISGTPVEDQILTAGNSLADADGLGPIGYQWRRNGVDIGGATAATYTLGDADVNTMISVVASYTDGGGTTESVNSAAVGAIANLNDAPTGAVTISGTATEDQMLTASNTLADADGLGLIGYQWKRDGVDIGGATTANYTLSDADVNTTITVVASYTDGWGTSESVSSAGVGLIANVNDAPAATGFTAAIAENSANGTTVGSVSVSDIDAGVDGAVTLAITSGNIGGAFAIDNAGNVTVSNSATIDFETNPVFSLQITATDGGSPGLSDTATITVNVNDLNDVAPTIVPVAGQSIAEDAANGLSVVTLTATDVDSPATAFAWTITGGNADGVFAIDPLTGTVFVTDNSSLDAETTGAYALTVVVSDGLNPSAAVNVVVAVTDVNEFSIGPLSDTNGAVNQYVIGSLPSATGVTALAGDADVTDSVSYSLDDDAGGRFAIHAVTGAVIWVGSPLDSADMQTIVVRATSTDGSTVTQSFDIDVTTLIAPPPVTVDSDPDDDTTPADSDSEADPLDVAPAVQDNEPAETTSATDDNSPTAPTEELPTIATTADEVATVVPESELTEARDGWRKGDLGSHTRSHITVTSEVADSDLASHSRQLQFLAQPTALWNALDESQSNLDDAMASQTLVIGASSAVTGGFTVGYVLWILRGGALVSSLLAQMPAWSLMDPMIVLQYAIEEDENAESLDEIFDEHEESNERELIPTA